MKRFVFGVAAVIAAVVFGLPYARAHIIPAAQSKLHHQLDQTGSVAKAKFVGGVCTLTLQSSPADTGTQAKLTTRVYRSASQAWCSQHEGLAYVAPSGPKGAVTFKADAGQP
jgi:hypothetical protein